MPEPDAHPFHLDITFSVGTSTLVIAPFAFDVNPSRRDSGVIYCAASFDAPLCKSCRVDEVFTPENFRDLRAALADLMNMRPASISLNGLEAWLSLEGAWDAERRVIVFRASLPASVGPENWMFRHGSPYRGSMKADVQLEFWMEPADLEEPLAEVEAILEHIDVLRAAFRFQERGWDAEEGA